MRFEEIRGRALAVWRDFNAIERPRVLVGAATCGRAAGASDLVIAIKDHLVERRIDARIVETGCLGLCYCEPLIEVATPGGPRVLYAQVTQESAPGILDSHILNDRFPPEHALATMDGSGFDGIPAFADLPMLKGQVRVATRNCGRIDPSNIDHYIARGGYDGLSKALQMSSEEAIAEVKKSGLRGRGGAGFPTGVKWEFCHRSVSDAKYMICNADEGDPGAFMDRTVLESDPHSVLEGMLIAAYAIGASRGYIYVRAEYPLAVERLSSAIAQMRQRALLGEKILASGFSFDISIEMGAGAFVCGEETALMASLEGKRGMPHPRPPFPASSGLHGKPTNINNVETLANVPVIMSRGAEKFAEYGTEASPGTKTFALAGKIVRTGLIEVPLGITLREIIFDIGGGIPDGRRFKAVQTGGPSGGCLPANLLELPVDYDTLKEAGSIMGSGGMIVMDEDTCIVDIARYFIEFTQNESCGKCVPCRLGTRQMLDILTDITAGSAGAEDIDLLVEIGEAVKKGSLCGLGQTAPNPVITTVKYFRDEYDAHVRLKKCFAAVCRDLVIAPCRHTCPAEIDVPRYLRHIHKGEFDNALAVIREKIPFPSVCGRICVHPCETRCRRAQLDDPVAVRALKRLAAERGGPGPELAPVEPTGKRVAVIGSGPAGLTAAYYLSRQGHDVTVFESLAKPGGMMLVGIPRFRLPESVLDGEIADIQKAGFEIKTNTRVDSIEPLLSEGYDAVFVAIGAHKASRMDIPGEDSEGVIDCLTFLREVNLGDGAKLSGRVAVIGGGNAAMDAARVALRQGADEVMLVYRRTRAQMPASDEEIEDTFSEGVKSEFLVTPVRIDRRDAKLAVTCRRMKLGRIDSSGRPSPEPVEGSDFVLEVDTVITAIGQAADISENMGFQLGKRGLISADRETMMTSREGVFAGGDAVAGPSFVIDAIAAGRRAASQIDIYLGGTGNIDEVFAPAEEVSEEGVREEEGERLRIPIPKIPASSRVGSMDEVELGYSPEMAMEEAGRCLHCDLEETEED